MSVIIATPHMHLSRNLITKPVMRLVNQAVKTFKKQKLASAPYAEVVGVLTGYEYANDAKGCGGYCNYQNSIINLAPLDHEYYVPGGVRVKRETIALMTIFHEIAHALQAHVERFESSEMLYLSKRIETEWEAESVSYHLTNQCLKFVPAKAFNSYMNKKDILFFKDYYKRSNKIADDIVVCPQ